MYQGASDDFIGAHDPVFLPAESDDIDFEGEAAVVLDDVPMGGRAQDALIHITKRRGNAFYVSDVDRACGAKA